MFQRVILIMALLFAGRNIYAQNITYSVSGVVTDATDALPVPGVLVECHENNVSALTDSAGVFVIKNLAPGHYHFHFEMVGYAAFAKDVDVTSASISNLSISLKASTIELKHVLVESEIFKSTYLQQSLDLMVLDKQEWTSSSAMTLSQRLTRLPGVNQLQTGVGVSKPVIRGLSGNRIVVSDLGMKQEGQQWGSDHGLEIDAFAAEKVEVIKGPASLMYGSDALGGVVRVQTPSIVKKGLRGEVASLARTNNDYIGTSAMLEGSTGKFFAKARLTFSDYGDYRVPAERFTYLNRTLPIVNQRLKNTAGEELHWQVTGGYVFNRGIIKLTQSHFSQKNGLFPGIVGIPTGNAVADDGDVRNVAWPRQEVDHFKTALNATFHLNHGWLEVDAGRQVNLRKEIIRPHREGYAPLPDNPLAHRLELTTYQASARWHAPRLGAWRFIPGMTAQQQSNERAGWEFLLPNHRSVSWGAFVFGEWNKSETSIFNFGIRYDYAHQWSDNFQTPIYAPGEVIVGYTDRVGAVDRNFMNYSASAGWSKVFDKNWNVKTNVARSFRVPNAAELLINGIHHGTFRHEQGDASLNSEIGYQLDAALVYDQESVHFKLTPYFNYFDGYIYLRPTARFSELPDGGQVYRYTQHDAVFAGAELYAEWHPIESLHLEGSVDGVYAYNVNTTLGLPFTPPVRARLMTEYEKDIEGKRLHAWNIGFNYLVWADQYNVDRNEDATKGAYTLDVFAGLEFKIANTIVNGRIAANNLLNRFYFNHMSAYRQLLLPEQGRNVSFALQIPFEIIHQNKNK